MWLFPFRPCYLHIHLLIFVTEKNINIFYYCKSLLKIIYNLYNLYCKNNLIFIFQFEYKSNFFKKILITN
jgi:hypothetical protein